MKKRRKQSESWTIHFRRKHGAAHIFVQFFVVVDYCVVLSGRILTEWAGCIQSLFYLCFACIVTFLPLFCFGILTGKYLQHICCHRFSHISAYLYLQCTVLLLLLLLLHSNAIPFLFHLIFCTFVHHSVLTLCLCLFFLCLLYFDLILYLIFVFHLNGEKRIETNVGFPIHIQQLICMDEMAMRDRETQPKWLFKRFYSFASLFRHLCEWPLHIFRTFLQITTEILFGFLLICDICNCCELTISRLQSFGMDILRRAAAYMSICNSIFD